MYVWDRPLIKNLIVIEPSTVLSIFVDTRDMYASAAYAFPLKQQFLDFCWGFALFCRQFIKAKVEHGSHVLVVGAEGGAALKGGGGSAKKK